MQLNTSLNIFLVFSQKILNDLKLTKSIIDQLPQSIEETVEIL